MNSSFQIVPFQAHSQFSKHLFRNEKQKFHIYYWTWYKIIVKFSIFFILLNR